MPSDIDLIERDLKGLSLADMRTHSTKTTSEIALELFELASAKEHVGLLTEAADYYRKAYKLDDRVDMRYREKLINDLPPLEKRAGGVPKVDHRFRKLDLSKIKVRRLLESFRECRFEPLDEARPVYLSILPDEIVMRILRLLIVDNPTSWFSFSMTCKKLAYLGFYDTTVWRILAKLVYKHQVYGHDDDINYRILIRKQWKLNCIKMLNERPFIKYRGIYISTVISQREGGRGESSNSWYVPFRMITYYRYLRFFDDGLCLKLLTILEPKRVIPKFRRNYRELITREGMNEAESSEAAATAVREWHRVYEGKFNLSLQGDVIVESEGAYDPWKFVDRLKIANGGKYARHDKLQWVEMGYKNKRNGELGSFSLESEKDFVFVRTGDGEPLTRGSR